MISSPTTPVKVYKEKGGGTLLHPFRLREATMPAGYL